MLSEKKRQKKVVNLIASENYVSVDVLRVLGSELTNKYPEGYPHARYYAGQVNVDELEDLCIERALALFGLSSDQWHANVQPLSGSPANFAVYTALVPRSATSSGKIMGMSLTHGGHLTHGQKVSATGKFGRVCSSVSRLKRKFWIMTKLTKLRSLKNLTLLSLALPPIRVSLILRNFVKSPMRVAHCLWLICRILPDWLPGVYIRRLFPYADVVTTTTHKTLRGPRAAIIFSKKDNRELHKKIDKAVFPGLQGGPHMNAIGAMAVALREAHTKAFKTYAEHVVKNATALAFELQKLGWRIVSGGTDTHVFLVDVWMGGKGLTGGEASDALEKVVSL